MKIGYGKLIIIGGLLLIGLWFFFSGSNNDDIIADIKTKAGAKSGLTVVAFGDSLTAGYGLPESESYPAQLQIRLNQLGYKVKVINSGISGETTSENLKRVAEIKSLNPDIVILGIGGNDALRQLSVIEAKKNILAAISALQSSANPPIIILLEMQASPTSGLSYKKDFDNLYEEVALEKKVILLPFITTQLFLDSKNKLSDGLHYNALGYEKVIDKYLLPTIVQVLDKLRGK